MSNLPQGSQSRQPQGYPSPTSYPSPSLSSSQYNYPIQGQPEPYRASPTGSNGSLNLPSIQHMNSMNNPSNLPPVSQMQPYYHNQGQQLPHPSHQYANVTSDPSGMRFALPATDSRNMSGGRHKKVSVGVIDRSRAGLSVASLVSLLTEFVV